MTTTTSDLQESAEQRLWPLVADYGASLEVAGLAVAVVREADVVARCFGVRDRRTGSPVTPQTMFHLASVSKPFVATAIVSLAVRHGGSPALDLTAPITDWVPELTLADGREAEVTVRGLLSHSSGLPDVAEYGWHDPQLTDDALSEFARSLSGWQLASKPGSTFSYSNAGYELLGLALSRATGMTFEAAMQQVLLRPLGMPTSTFLRAEVPAELRASPHVGMPLVVPGDAYPFTRRHAPSSTLHSNLVELCRWVAAHVTPTPPTDGSVLDPAVVKLMGRPVVPIGDPPWDEAQGLGWAVGRYRGCRTLSHSGGDPGFGSRLVLVPEHRTGVVVLANSNTVATSLVAMAALDVALAETTPSEGAEAEQGDDGLRGLASLRPPIARRVAEVLVADGPEAATATYRQLVAEDPARYDLDDEGFADAVWGAIELHRTDLVWPLLQLWTVLRPESSAVWTMTGWAHHVDGDTVEARRLLERALELDPDNADATLILGTLPR